MNYLTLLGAAPSMGQPADFLRSRASLYDRHDRTADAITARILNLYTPSGFERLVSEFRA